MRHIILQVGIQPFVAQIEGGGEADQQCVDLKLIEPEGGRELLETQIDAGLLGGGDRLLHGVARGGFGGGEGGGLFGIKCGDRAPVGRERSIEQIAGFGVGDFQAAEGIGGILAGELPSPDGAAQTHIQQG